MEKYNKHCHRQRVDLRKYPCILCSQRVKWNGNCFRSSVCFEIVVTGTFYSFVRTTGYYEPVGNKHAIKTQIDICFRGVVLR